MVSIDLPLTVFLLFGIICIIERFYVTQCSIQLYQGYEVLKRISDVIGQAKYKELARLSG